MWEDYLPSLTRIYEGRLLDLKQNAVLGDPDNGVDESQKLDGVFAANGLRPRITHRESTSYAVDESGNKIFDQVLRSTDIYVFGESGRINRLGAYIVHVALLTLFLGHFVALRTGFDADVRMIPGDGTDKIQMIQFDLDKTEKFDVQLPFTMTYGYSAKVDRSARSIDVTIRLTANPVASRRSGIWDYPCRCQHE